MQENEAIIISGSSEDSDEAETVLTCTSTVDLLPQQPIPI